MPNKYSMTLWPHQTTAWLSDDCPMAVWWLSADCPMTVPWLSDDCPMTLPFLSNGCLITAWWMSNDSPITVWWKSNDCPMTVRWLPGVAQRFPWCCFTLLLSKSWLCSKLHWHQERRKKISIICVQQKFPKSLTGYKWLRLVISLLSCFKLSDI